MRTERLLKFIVLMTLRLRVVTSQDVRLRELFTGFLLQKVAKQKSDYTRIL